MNKALVFPFIFISVFFFSCQNCIKGVGEVQPETRSVEPFDEIESNTFINVSFREIRSSDVDKVVVNAQENLQPYIKALVDGDRLYISIDECIETDKNISIEIYGRTLRYLENNGSGDFISEDKLKTQKLEIESNGSGDIQMKLDVNSLDVTQNSSGDIILSGATDYLEVTQNSSGDVDADELRSFETEIESNSSGDVSTYTKESLEVSINSSGDVEYKGKPKVSESINSSGSLKTIK